MGGVSSARLKRLAAGAGAGVMVGVLVAIIAHQRPNFLERAEWSAYDVRASRVASGQPSTDIVMIDVAESDIQNAEQIWGVTWPWPRAVWGYIAEYVQRGGAKVVAFDWIFQDRGQYSVDDAEEFAETIAGLGNVVVGLAIANQPSEKAPPGKWGLKVRAVETREEAEKVALRLMAWDVRSYLIGQGPTTIYIGGLLGADAVSAMWDRLSAFPELADSLGIAEEATTDDDASEDEAAQEADASEPGPSRDPALLSDAVLAASYTLHDLLEKRDSFAADAFDADFPVYNDILEPLAVIGAAPRRMGGVTQRRDDDGVMRRHIPFYNHRGRMWPSLAMAAYLVANPDLAPRANQGELILDDRTVPLDDSRGRFIVRFGKKGRYRHVPAFELLRSTVLIEEGKEPSVDLSLFKDKYVIVSAVSYALRDSHSSPVAQVHPGAEIQANALENLIAGEAVRRSGRLLDATIVLAASVVSALIVMFAWGAIRRVGLALLVTFALALGLGLLWWQFAVWMLAARSLWIAGIAPLFAIGASAFAAVLTASAGERRSKRFVQEALGRYTSPALVAELTEHPEHLSLEWGELRPMSVYFSDIAGFTTISEALSPEQLVRLLNEYLTSMTDIILANDGVVDKYIGDAIMAFWGAPIADKNHAIKAVRCAIAMRNQCEELRSSWQERFGQHVMARAGVNSGEAVVGNMGSAHKYNYTVMGDMVNLAARLEGANKPYGSELMISEYTLEMLGGEIAVRELDLLAVKGKVQPVRVFEVLDLEGQVPEDKERIVRAFEAALELYRNRSFGEALAAFEAVVEIGPDGPSALYAERCRAFIEQPPPADWDGVWRMTTK